jgi:hypothetical protein
MGHSRGRAKSQRGQIMILFTLMIVLLMGLAAIVVDVGVLRRSSAMLATSVDAAALAGGEQLPATSVNGTAITTSAVSYLNANYSGLGATSSWISYLCLVQATSGTPPAPTLSNITDGVCQPGSPANGSTSSAYWKCNASVCTTPCAPATVNNKCNVIVVAGAANVPYQFGPAIGIGSGSTGTVQSASCQGACGGPPTAPVDVVLIMDRTGSMNGADTTNAKAAANSLTSFYNPANQWLALGTLGPSATSGGCAAAPAGSIGTANAPADLSRWVPVGLSGAGLARDGLPAANTTYAKITSNITCYTNSGTGTDLADPVTMAAYELNNNGRSGVRKGIILETDGQPNAAVGSVSNSAYCAQADAAAQAAKLPTVNNPLGIVIFTIGFGLDATSGGDPPCPDTAGAWHNKTATALLASMSTQPTKGTTDCTAAENTDGDNFFCQPKSADLTSIFKVVAGSLATGARLVSVP